MAWVSGVELAERIWNVIKDELPKHRKEMIARSILCAFEERGCDCLHGTDLYVTARPTFFVSGHLDLTEEEFRKHYKWKLDQAMLWESRIVVGDARGADAMAQDYLASKEYGDVVVFHMLDEPRHLASKFWDRKGGWQSDEERDAAATRHSDTDIAWVRPGRESSGTARNLSRRKMG